MFKIAYCAGHCLSTPGKRVPAALDKAQTREWVLNDRVARFFNERMLQYEGVQTMRTDDPTGKKEISIKDRTAAANKWGANLYIDIHFNAGIDLGCGGGVTAFCYPNSIEGRMYRDAIYYAVIVAGGLKGNRSKPLREKAYKSLKLAKAPAVLIEYGFIDSQTDYPLISTEEYASAVGYATADAVAQVAGLKLLPQFEKREENCTMLVKVLSRGDKGNHVKAMQILLIGRGFSCGSTGADGNFGPATEKAVLEFKKASGLTENNICDAETWTKLMGL